MYGCLNDRFKPTQKKYHEDAAEAAIQKHPSSVAFGKRCLLFGTFTRKAWLMPGLYLHSSLSSLQGPVHSV